MERQFPPPRAWRRQGFQAAQEGKTDLYGAQAQSRRAASARAPTAPGTPRLTPRREGAAVRSAVRAEIQALRAVAVVLVVVYHLWPAVLPGGFVGVDVFFVISGFLITSLLLREVERDRAGLAARASGRGARGASCRRRCVTAAGLRARHGRSSSRRRTGSSSSPRCARARSTCRTGSSPTTPSTTSPPPTRRRPSSTSGRCRSRSSSTSCGRSLIVWRCVVTRGAPGAARRRRSRRAGGR